MKWYIQVLEKYALFSGRASRTEYWMFTLFNIIFAVAAILLDNLLDTTFHFSTASGYENMQYGAIYLVYIFAVIIPSLAVAVRRLHDTGKSGWYILLNLIPLLGAIWLFILLTRKGDYREKNRYGYNPEYRHSYHYLSADTGT